MVSKGNHPQMAARFRLVKYYNLPRFINPVTHFLHDSSRHLVSVHRSGFQFLAKAGANPEEREEILRDGFRVSG